MDVTKNNSEEEIKQAETDLQRFAKAMQREVYNIVAGFLLDLAFGDGGRVIYDVQNIRAGYRASQTVRARLVAEQPNLLQRIIAAMLRLFERNTDYFASQNLTIAAEDEARRKLLLLYGYDEETGRIIPDSYLSALVNTTDLATKVGRTMQLAVQSGQTLTQMRTRLKTLIVGSQTTPGDLEKHFTRITGDFMANYDRSVAEEYADRLGLNYSVFAGTLEDDSRAFCINRVNRVYSRAEWASWNNKKWKGKNLTIPVEIACGGYECRHKRNYVSDEVAMVIAKQRGGIDTYATPSRGEIR